MQIPNFGLLSNVESCLHGEKEIDLLLRQLKIIYFLESYQQFINLIYIGGCIFDSVLYFIGKN